MVTYFIGKVLLCVGIVPGRRYTKAYFLHVISLGNNNARSLKNYVHNLLYYVLIT